MVPLLTSLVLLVLLPIISAADSDLNGHTCGNTTVDYPFGFTSDRPIRLNCSEKGLPLIGQFHVIEFSPDSLVLSVPPSFNRPISAADVFFGEDYVITSTNSLLLGNCSSGLNSSRIGRGSNGDGGDEIVYERSKDGFLVKEFAATGCTVLISSNNGTDEGFALLDWWLEGGCEVCSDDTQCRMRNHPVTQKPTVSCKCNEGLAGDGFVAGEGCRKAKHKCDLSRYISGKCGSDSTIAILIGGVIVGAVLMASIALLCYFIKKRANHSQRRNSTRRLLSEASCTIPLHDYKEIERATDGFSDKNRLGTGAYGTVYFGKLHNGEGGLVAVKKLRNHDGDSTMERVMNEIKLLSSVSHPNLVRLLGCCIEREEYVLVYEFMPNGTLSEHLHREKEPVTVLPWSIRLNIAADTAKAIAHLHSAIHPPIYHRDIKSSNILLDYNFNSKLADFGLSRMIVPEVDSEASHVSTTPQGTPGYVDPQYHQNFHLSDKSDVYSFGVVLVEIITAKKAVDFTRGQSEINLAALAVSKIGKGCLEEIIDPALDPNRDAWTLSSIHKVAELAFRCLAFHRDMRPSMMEVAEELEQLRHGGWVHSDENIVPSTKSSLQSSTLSIVTEKSRGTVKKKGLFYVNSMAVEVKREEKSPLSVHDPWLSEQSSPSSNSLLGSVHR